MLRRKIEKEISDWIKTGRNALLIDGARQVGKTYTIRHCLEEAGVSYIELNLIENTDALYALNASKTADDLKLNLSAITSLNPEKEETVIFIDEVQELKEIVTLIKFWVDDGSFRYILSGSLLGVELNALRSAPVGYIHELKMFPMDFEEFMEAAGVTDSVRNHLRECFESCTPVGEAIHGRMMKLFRRYLVVGGMPQAVSEFVTSMNIERVSGIQRDIITYYKRDFTKYEAAEKKLMLSSVYDKIPAELLRQNRRFHYADIQKGLRFERVEDSFIWLYKSGVVLHAFNITEPRTGLKLNEKSSLVKLYYSDTGLLTYACGEALRRDILFDTGRSNLGGIYENAVIQELCAHDFEVYYYNSKKLGELDFVVEHELEVLPIEVKSGKEYYVHSAINNVLNNPGFDIHRAVVFTGYDLKVSGDTVYYPIYMAGFLQKNKEMKPLEPIEF